MIGSRQSISPKACGSQRFESPKDLGSAPNGVWRARATKVHRRFGSEAVAKCLLVYNPSGRSLNEERRNGSTQPFLSITPPTFCRASARSRSPMFRMPWQKVSKIFKAMPSHLVFLGLIYPIFGLVLARIADDSRLMPLIFPLAAGFALIGPFAAIALYELSRRRE
jgi:hypothetical protein